MRTVLTRQIDRRIDGVALEGQERAELENDALVELVGPGGVALAGCTLALHAPGEGPRLGRADRQNLAVDHLDTLVGQLAEALLKLHLRDDQSRVRHPQRPDLLTLGPLPTGVSCEKTECRQRVSEETKNRT